jgi:MFS family permease
MRTRTVALFVLAATQLMVILDGTIVTIALPAIRSGLGFSDASLSWVVNAFFAAFAVALLPAGRLGDRVGAKPVFLAGLALFTLATAWCGLAWDPASLIVARVLQGGGGGVSSAVVLGMIAALFPEPSARLGAFAVLAFVGSAGASIGLVAGGVLTQLADWRWIFLVNIPIGVAAIATGGRAIAGTSGHTSRGGLVPRSLLVNPRFALANGVLFTMVMAGMSFQFLCSLYLQDTLGYGPLSAGLGFLTVTGAIAVASLGLSGRLAARFGAEHVLLSGLVLFTAGILLMVRLPDHGRYIVDVAPGFLIMGAGFGLAMPQVTDLAMAAAPPEFAGAASGFFNTTQQAGIAIGLFVISSVAAATDRSVGFLLADAGLLVGTALALYLTRLRRRQDWQHHAEQPEREPVARR